MMLKCVSLFSCGLVLGTALAYSSAYAQTSGDVSIETKIALVNEASSTVSMKAARFHVSGSVQESWPVSLESGKSFASSTVTIGSIKKDSKDNGEIYYGPCRFKWRTVRKLNSAGGVGWDLSQVAQPANQCRAEAVAADYKTGIHEVRFTILKN